MQIHKKRIQQQISKRHLSITSYRQGQHIPNSNKNSNVAFANFNMNSNAMQ
jgi:hypothetical protein